MKLLVFITSKCASNYCAEKLAELVIAKPNCVLGFATGSTFIETYKILSKKSKQDSLNFSLVKSFNLDEYINCQGTEKISYRYFMQQHLFNKINIKPTNIYFPESKNPSLESLKKYDQLILKSSIDLQLLGIGRNGHIAFNEPTSKTEFNTHIVNLSETTIKDNAKLFFNNQLNAVPKQAVSMGINNILSAKKIIIAAFGKNKADAISKFCKSNKIDSWLPVSYLNSHKDVELVLDKEAAKKIDFENLKSNVEVNWL